MIQKAKLTGLAGKAAEIIRNRKIAVITDLFTGVVADTPVKTGRLKANYNVSKGTPDTTTRDSFEDPTPAVKTAVAAMVTPGNESIFLSNGVPYGPIIEYEGGSPVKAPRGMVRTNVVRAIEKLRK